MFLGQRIWCSASKIIWTRGIIELLIIAAGVLSGILLHDIGLLTIVSVTRKAMNRKMIRTFTIVAGFLLIGFACYFIYEFIQGIKIYI